MAGGIALVRGANADGGGHDEQQCEDEYPGVTFHGTCGTTGSRSGSYYCKHRDRELCQTGFRGLKKRDLAGLDVVEGADDGDAAFANQIVQGGTSLTDFVHRAQDVAL
jgi:hypothetical protein